MAANVHRLKPKTELIQREAAAQIAEQLSLFPEASVPAAAKAVVLNALHRVTHPDREEGIWPGGFTMISRIQTAAIWDAIRALPADERPGHVRHAFDLVLLNLRQDTGEVMLTREQFAEKIGCSVQHVSHVMATLERLGVIRRERRRVEGLRGPGMAVYFLNPHVAWNGSLDMRKEKAAEEKSPLLRLLDAPRELFSRTVDKIVEATNRAEESGSLLPKGPREV